MVHPRCLQDGGGGGGAERPGAAVQRADGARARVHRPRGGAGAGRALRAVRLRRPQPPPRRRLQRRALLQPQR